MERATIKRAKSRIDGSVRLASVLLSPLNRAITAERCLASPLGFQTSPIAPVGCPKCQEWVKAGRRHQIDGAAGLPSVAERQSPPRRLRLVLPVGEIRAWTLRSIELCWLVRFLREPDIERGE